MDPRCVGAPAPAHVTGMWAGTVLANIEDELGGGVRDDEEVGSKWSKQGSLVGGRRQSFHVPLASRETTNAAVPVRSKRTTLTHLFMAIYSRTRLTSHRLLLQFHPPPTGNT